MKLQEQGKTEQARKDLGEWSWHELFVRRFFELDKQVALLFHHCYVVPLIGHLVNAERLAIIRQQRAEAAKKREEEKAGNYALKSCSSFVLFHLSKIPTFTK